MFVPVVDVALTPVSKQAGNQYLTTLSIWFIGYVLFEIPSNIVLRRTSPQFWLPTLTLVWGIVCTLMGLTQNFAGFLAVRFFLGVAESGLFPGVVFYLSMWYKRNEQHYRIALFLSAATLAGAFGGFLVSYFVLSLRRPTHWALGVRTCQNEGSRRIGGVEVDLHHRKFVCFQSLYGR